MIEQIVEWNETQTGCFIIANFLSSHFWHSPRPRLISLIYSSAQLSVLAQEEEDMKDAVYSEKWVSEIFWQTEYKESNFSFRLVYSLNFLKELFCS